MIARPPPSEMVERVARAIWDSASGGYAMPFNDLPADSCYRATCLSVARAAIEAMREPTNDMRNAGVRAVMRYRANIIEPEYVRLNESDVTYKAYIDAALKDSP